MYRVVRLEELSAKYDIRLLEDRVRTLEKE
jgi:hypothetical protein